MKKLLVIVGLIVFVVVADYYRDNRVNNQVEPDPEPITEMTYIEEEDNVHYHAGFLVYDEGELVDFTPLKYMHLNNCGDDHEDVDEEHEQIEKAHLHDGVGDVVHVHRSGAVWGDLFANIGYEIDWSQVTAYKEGGAVEGIESVGIIPNESVIIIVGSEEGVDLDSYVSLDRIEEVSAMSEDCGAE